MIGIRQIAIAALGTLLWLPQLNAGTLAIFRTTLGEMAVELFDEEKPKTVRNFTRLVELGAYSEFPSIIHRCEPGFVAQGGEFIVPSQTSTNAFYLIEDVFNLGPITNEYSVGKIYSNEYGTISMAKKAGLPDSATSVWFFNLADNPILNTANGGFTVFGRVIKGSNVLESLNNRSFTNGIINMTKFWGTNSFTVQFSNLPVTYVGDQIPQFNQLIFPNIEILKIGIDTDASGNRTLSWNSPSTMTCHIQYQETTGGSWESLHVTNGNGLVQSVVDTNSPMNTRNYRIWVE